MNIALCIALRSAFAISRYNRDLPSMPPGLAYNQSACYLIRLSIPEPARFESGRSRSALRPKYGTRFCQWPVERRFGRFWDKPSNLATDSQPAVVPLAADSRFHIRWRFLPIDNSCHRRSSKASRPRPKTSNNKKAEMRSRVRARGQRLPSPNRRNLRDIRSLLAPRSRPDSHHILHDRRTPHVHHILRDHRQSDPRLRNDRHRSRCRSAFHEATH